MTSPCDVACALLVGVLGLGIPSAAAAQARGASATAPLEEGSFPDAVFDATFRKYTPPDNIFSPFYSWDAHMALDVTVVRKGPDALVFAAMFQTVGTENLGSRVSVGGTGYLLDLGYVHTYSERLRMSAGLAHFSSHLTRNLDDKTDEEQVRGHPIPGVDDPSEYNVFFFKVQARLSALNCSRFSAASAST